MGEPPLAEGPVHRAVAVVSTPPVAPPTAGRIVGAEGTVAGVTDADSAENGPCPTTFSAATCARKARPSTSPVTSSSVTGPVAVQIGPTRAPEASTTLTA